MKKIIKDMPQNEEKTPQIGGLVDIGIKDTDFTFGSYGVAFELISKQKSLGQPKYFYNQGAQPETAYWCTIYSCITEISYLKNYRFSDSEIFEIGRKMVKDGKLNPTKGAYLSDAVDYCRNYWNTKFPKDKIASYQIDYTDKDLLNMLTYNEKTIRLTQLGYKLSTELAIELENTGVALKDNYPKSFGHAVS